VQSGGQNYLIPVDAKIWDEQDVRHAGVAPVGCLRVSRALVRISASRSHRCIPAATPMRGASGVTRMALRPSRQDENALILTSEPPGAVADELGWITQSADHRPSHEMGSSTRSVEEIFERTRLVVAHTTQNQQLPTVSSSLTDDVNLGPAPANATVSSGQNTSLDRRGCRPAAVSSSLIHGPCDSASNPCGILNLFSGCHEPSVKRL